MNHAWFCAVSSRKKRRRRGERKADNEKNREEKKHIFYLSLVKDDVHENPNKTYRGDESPVRDWSPEVRRFRPRRRVHPTSERPRRHYFLCVVCFCTRKVSSKKKAVRESFFDFFFARNKRQHDARSFFCFFGKKGRRGNRTNEDEYDCNNRKRVRERVLHENDPEFVRLVRGKYRRRRMRRRSVRFVDCKLCSFFSKFALFFFFFFFVLLLQLC